MRSHQEPRKRACAGTIMTMLRAFLAVPCVAARTRRLPRLLPVVDAVKVFFLRHVSPLKPIRSGVTRRIGFYSPGGRND